MRKIILCNFIILLLFLFLSIEEKNNLSTGKKEQSKGKQYVELNLYYNFNYSGIENKFKQLQNLYDSNHYLLKLVNCIEKINFQEFNCKGLKTSQNDNNEFTFKMERIWMNQTKKEKEDVKNFSLSKKALETMNVNQIKGIIDEFVHKEIIILNKHNLDLLEITDKINSIIYISSNSSIPYFFSKFAFENKGKILFGFVNSQNQEHFFKQYYGNHSIPYLIAINSFNSKKIKFEFFEGLKDNNHIEKNLTSYLKALDKNSKEGKNFHYILNPREDLLLLPLNDLNITDIDVNNNTLENEIRFLFSNSKKLNKSGNSTKKTENKNTNESQNIINNNPSMTYSNRLDLGQLMNIKRQVNSEQKMIFIYFSKDPLPYWFKILLECKFYLNFYKFYNFSDELNDEIKSELRISDNTSIILILPNIIEKLSKVEFPFSTEPIYISSFLNEFIVFEDFTRAFPLLKFTETKELRKGVSNNFENCSSSTNFCLVLLINANNKVE